MPGGPTAVEKSLIGAEVLGLRSRGAGAVVVEAMFVAMKDWKWECGEQEREGERTRWTRWQFSSCSINTQ
jgi:hypothetical protein